MKSEEEQDRMLLETKIIKDDGYQKQQGKSIIYITILYEDPLPGTGENEWHDQQTTHRRQVCSFMSVADA